MFKNEGKVLTVSPSLKVFWGVGELNSGAVRTCPAVASALTARADVRRKLFDSLKNVWQSKRM